MPTPKAPANMIKKSFRFITFVYCNAKSNYFFVKDFYKLSYVMNLNFSIFIKKTTKNNFEMKYNSNLTFRSAIFVIVLISASQTATLNAQQSIGFGIHADPLVGWFSSDNNAIIGKGVGAGFNFGLEFNKYFHENYAFSTGVSLITAGGTLSSSSPITLDLKNPITISPGSKMVYKIQYLAIPIGLKLKSNQIGYISLFTNIGLDPKFVLGGNIEVPSQNIPKENANNELNRLSVGYHVVGGIEYSLGGTTSVVVGINFDSNFTNIIKKSANKPTAKILHKMLGLRLGLNF